MRVEMTIVMNARKSWSLLPIKLLIKLHHWAIIYMLYCQWSHLLFVLLSYLDHQSLPIVCFTVFSTSTNNHSPLFVLLSAALEPCSLCYTVSSLTYCLFYCLGYLDQQSLPIVCFTVSCTYNYIIEPSPLYYTVIGPTYCLFYCLGYLDQQSLPIVCFTVSCTYIYIIESSPLCYTVSGLICCLFYCLEHLYQQSLPIVCFTVSWTYIYIIEPSPLCFTVSGPSPIVSFTVLGTLINNHCLFCCQKSHLLFVLLSWVPPSTITLHCLFFCQRITYCLFYCLEYLHQQSLNTVCFTVRGSPIVCFIVRGSPIVCFTVRGSPIVCFTVRGSPIVWFTVLSISLYCLFYCQRNTILVSFLKSCVACFTAKVTLLLTILHQGWRYLFGCTVPKFFQGIPNCLNFDTQI